MQPVTLQQEATASAPGSTGALAPTSPYNALTQSRDVCSSTLQGHLRGDHLQRRTPSLSPLFLNETTQEGQAPSWALRPACRTECSEPGIN